MNVLIDTDIWIDFFKDVGYASELIEKLTIEGKVVSSILTITELRAGWTNTQAKERISRFYKLSKILPVTTAIAEIAGGFINHYSLKGISLPTVDTIIGATSIINDCELATRNKKDFPMPEITFYEF